MEMKFKLTQFLEAENLKPGQLAEILGVNAGRISHLLSGRNQPSLDFLQKILQRFPRLNPDWLLLDSPQMFRQLSDNQPNEQPQNHDEIPFDASTPNVNQGQAPSHIADVVEEQSRMEAVQIPAGSGDRRVTRIIVLYDDNTCETYTPNH